MRLPSVANSFARMHINPFNIPGAGEGSIHNVMLFSDHGIIYLYLLQLIAPGVKTTLSADYQESILLVTGAAQQALKAQSDKSGGGPVK